MKSETRGLRAAYIVYEDYITSIAQRFVRRYGGDPDDALGDALVAFVQGHQKWSEGNVTTGYDQCIYNWIWFGLLDKRRPQLTRRGTVQACGDAIATYSDKCRDLQAWLSELSDDAREVVVLTLDAPKALQQAADAKGGTPRNIRSSVRQWLLGQGWANARITTAFAEIRAEL